MEKQFDVSLIICTKDRAGPLKECLQRVDKISFGFPWELVIIDNGSTDNTSEIVQEFSSSSSIDVHYFLEPKRGSGAARNCGWKNATSALLIYIDDDCYPEVDFINQHWQIFLAHSDCTFIGGRIMLYDPTDLPVTIQTRDTPYEFKPYEHVHAGFIQSANIAVRKSALDTIGGWDDRLGAGTPYPSEDLDLVARLLAVGFSGRYEQGPCVYHHHRRKDSATLSKLFQGYDAGRGGFFAKCLLQPELRKIYIWPWIKRWRYQSSGTTFRELKSFFGFMYGSLIAKLFS